MKLIGDIIADLTTKSGVEPCAPCKARQERLNTAHQTFLDSISSKVSAIKSIFSK